MTRAFRTFLTGVVALALAAQAHAQQIALSSLVVELSPGKHDRDDVEISNTSPDRAFVVLAAREIVDAGTPAETSREERDPEKLGLLVSPDRMILEPGQRKLIRFASLATRVDRERVFRVAVKPVAGQLQSSSSGLKVLVGYDVLVLVRPTLARAQLVGTRSASQISFRNDGNVSLVIHDGHQCGAPGGKCSDLPGKRLYPGATWSTPVKSAGRIDYEVDSPSRTTKQQF